MLLDVLISVAAIVACPALFTFLGWLLDRRAKRKIAEELQAAPIGRVTDGHNVVDLRPVIGRHHQRPEGARRI